MSASQQAQANPPADETQHDQQARAGADFDVDELEQHLAANEPEHQSHGRLEVRQLAHCLRDDDVNAPQSHDGEQVARKHDEGILCGATDFADRPGQRETKRQNCSHVSQAQLVTLRIEQPNVGKRNKQTVCAHATPPTCNMPSSCRQKRAAMYIQGIYGMRFADGG